MLAEYAIVAFWGVILFLLVEKYARRQGPRGFTPPKMLLSLGAVFMFACTILFSIFGSTDVVHSEFPGRWLMLVMNLCPWLYIIFQSVNTPETKAALALSKQAFGHPPATLSQSTEDESSETVPRPTAVRSQALHAQQKHQRDGAHKKRRHHHHHRKRNHPHPDGKEKDAPYHEPAKTKAEDDGESPKIPDKEFEVMRDLTNAFQKFVEGQRKAKEAKPEDAKNVNRPLKGYVASRAEARDTGVNVVLDGGGSYPNSPPQTDTFSYRTASHDTIETDFDLHTAPGDDGNAVQTNYRPPSVVRHIGFDEPTAVLRPIGPTMPVPPRSIPEENILLPSRTSFNASDEYSSRSQDLHSCSNRGQTHLTCVGPRRTPRKKIPWGAKSVPQAEPMMLLDEGASTEGCCSPRVIVEELSGQRQNIAWYGGVIVLSAILKLSYLYAKHRLQVSVDELLQRWPWNLAFLLSLGLAITPWRSLLCNQL